MVNGSMTHRHSSLSLVVVLVNVSLQIVQFFIDAVTTPISRSAPVHYAQSSRLLVIVFDVAVVRVQAGGVYGVRVEAPGASRGAWRDGWRREPVLVV